MKRVFMTVVLGIVISLCAGSSVAGPAGMLKGLARVASEASPGAASYVSRHASKSNKSSGSDSNAGNVIFAICVGVLILGMIGKCTSK